MEIGAKIRNIREDLDFSQEQIAALIPMNQSNYSKIERNLQEPNMYQLKRIAEILKLDLNELFDLSETAKTYTLDLTFGREIRRVYNEIYSEKK